jgi:hypothetical protein
LSETQCTSQQQGDNTPAKSPAKHSDKESDSEGTVVEMSVAIHDLKESHQPSARKKEKLA